MRRGPRSIVCCVALGFVLIVTACTGSSDNVASDSAPTPLEREDWVDSVIPGGPDTLDELCDTGACVGDVVVLPQLEAMDARIDLPMPMTLGPLTLERMWTGTRDGLFGAGWESFWDLRIVDGQIRGPLPSPPMTQPLTDSTVELVDGSLLTFAVDGQITKACLPESRCVTAEWGDNTVTLTAEDSGAEDLELVLADGRVRVATTSDGRQATYAYENDGRLSTVVTPDGDLTYTYDTDGELRTIDGPADARSFTYQDGRLSAMVDRDGGQWTFSAARNQITVGMPGGASRSYTFDGDHLTAITEDEIPLLVRTFVNGALTREERPQEGIVLESSGNMLHVAQSRPDGPPTIADYILDQRGRVVAVTSAAGTTTYEFPASGPLAWSPTAVTGGGGTTEFDYDDAGLLLRTVDADGYAIEVDRLENGLPSSVGDGVISTSYEYDDAGRTVVESSGDRTATAEYGDRGELDAIVGSDGIRTNYSYDDSGRLTRISGPMTEALSYDASGSVDATVLPDGLIDAADAGPPSMEVTQNAGGTTTYAIGPSAVTYDEWGRPITVSGDGATVERTYDVAGRVSSLRFGDATYTLEYSPGGRVESISTDGIMIDVEWHGDLLVGVDTSSGTSNRYEYDEAGRLTRATSGPLEWDYAYDEAGRLSEIVSPAGSSRYEWDEAGRPTATVVGSGATEAYQWVGDLLTAVTASNGDVTEFTYDSESRLTNMSSGDGEMTVGYDASGRVLTYDLGEGGDGEVTYGSDGVSSVTFDGRTEEWTHGEDGVSTVRVGDDEYELSWSAPGVLEDVTRNGDPVASATIDDLQRTTSIRNGDGDVVGEFEWDRFGLTRAAEGDDEVRIERDPEGRVTSASADDVDVHASYSDGAVEQFTINGVALSYEYESGNLASSTVEVGERSTEIQWDASGSVPASFVSSEGEGSLEYMDGRVTSIGYDDQVRQVTYDDDGHPQADGTGQELLNDLFDTDGHFVGTPSEVQPGPSSPLLDSLPAELGVVLPDVVTGSKVVDDTMELAIPDLPVPLLPSDPDDLPGQMANLMLAVGAHVELPIGPASTFTVDLSPTGSNVDEALSMSPTARLSESVLNRLAGDPCMLCRALDVGMSVVSGVGGAVAAMFAFIANNPVARAIATVVFSALSIVLASMCIDIVCGAAVSAATIVTSELIFGNPSSIDELLYQAFVQPVVDLTQGVIRLDAASVISATVIIATVLNGRASRVVRSKASALSCDFSRVICVSQTRFGPAADHVLDAQRLGATRVLKVDRPLATSRRNSALRALDRVPGFDLDEYPPAFSSRRSGLSIRPIDPAANRSLGAYMGNQIRGLDDGTSILVRVVP